MKSQLACNGDSLKRTREELSSTKSRLEDTQRALEISKQEHASVTIERNSLEEKLQQNISQGSNLSTQISSLNELQKQSEEKLTDISKQLEDGAAKIRSLESNEHELQLRLDMQLEHSREMEVRLEQALTRWKQEKATSQKETDRCSRLRANCSDLVEKNQRLQLEMERQTAKLKLYDSLPMPDEIKARMNDLNSDLRSKTEEANDLMSAYEDLKKQHELIYEENQRLGDLLSQKDEDLAGAERDKEHMQSSIDHMREQIASINHSASLERSNSMTMLEGERKTISDLMKELEDTKESQRQDRVALAHALKAKKKALASQSMSRMGSIRSFDDGGSDSVHIDGTESALTSPNGKQNSVNASVDEENKEMEDIFEQDPADGQEVYTRDPDVRAKAQINIAIGKQDVELILELIKKNTKNENFAWRGARAVREIFIHSEEKKIQCIALKTDDVLISAMDMFPSAAMVQGQCLRAIGALSFGNDVVRRQAGEKGIFQKIVAAVDNHMNDESVLMHALTAMTNLTHNSIDNRFRLILQLF